MELAGSRQPHFLSSDMPLDSLYNQITEELPSITGWCSLEKAIALASAVVALRPTVVCELGIWGGKSAIPLALALQSLGDGKLIAVDPWKPSASVEGMEPVNAEWWGRADHEAVYQHFVGHVQRLKLSHLVHIRRDHSDAVTPEEQIGLLHLDGNHGPQALRDAKRFGPKVRLGGLLFADDLTWSGGHVSAAADHLKKIGFVELYRVKDENCEWGVFQRVKNRGKP